MEFDQPIPDPIHQPVVPSPPPLTWPTCCHRVGGPPDYAPLMDRQMEWSPIQPGASGGSSSWALQLVCFTCSWTFRVEDVPPLPEMSCPRWQLDRWSSPGRDDRGRRVCNWSQFQIHHSKIGSGVDHCAACPLNGWDARNLSRSGKGTQSWLFCPLISFGMLKVETTLNIPAYPTGLRAPEPECQRPSAGTVLSCPHPLHNESMDLHAGCRDRHHTIRNNGC